MDIRNRSSSKDVGEKYQNFIRIPHIKVVDRERNLVQCSYPDRLHLPRTRERERERERDRLTIDKEERDTDMSTFRKILQVELRNGAVKLREIHSLDRLYNRCMERERERCHCQSV
ncbi:hypothetical protein KP509_03G084400 [Ceratopteris richardii]|uniref:Uncharacterized protein n=1 Tax=Ceratopteris richardii TaxID=49495 RepID=A0A8T2V9J0_CERRI|nr:hypothetical protein KP509_03G084400 [Ceratopteris richardii]